MASRFAINLLLTALTLGVISSPAGGQGKPPVISTRQFTSGSAKVSVTGSFAVDQDIAINTMASFGDGGKTWFQFGASGSAEPNAAITVDTELGEIGIVVAKGKLLATGGIMVGEKSECSGQMDVKPKVVTGTYTCTGLTSHDPVTSRMGKVNVTIVFTAKT